MEKASPRILLVEDNIDNQLLAKFALQKAGYTVDVAINGKEAVDKSNGFRYDIIIMDIQMPEMDGFQATSKIRNWEKEHDQERVPIIALSAHAIDGYLEDCREKGMDDYITKPLRKDALIECVKKWLE